MEKFFSKNVNLFFFENRKIRLLIGQIFFEKKKFNARLRYCRIIRSVWNFYVNLEIRDKNCSKFIQQTAVLTLMSKFVRKNNCRCFLSIKFENFLLDFFRDSETKNPISPKLNVEESLLLFCLGCFREDFSRNF